MDYQKIAVTQSEGRLKITVRDGSNRPWYRDLDIDGKPLYRIGSICETCEALFRKTDRAKMPIDPDEISKRLRQGLQSIDEEIITAIKNVIPKGNYIISLIEIQPRMIKNTNRDFIWENLKPSIVPKELWPKTPNINEIWPPWSLGRLGQKLQDDELYESVLPLINFTDISQKIVRVYEKAIANGKRPTCLALSVVDTRYVSARAFDWRLVHFLLDGHHKMMAASKNNQSISILSFFALNESFAREEWIRHTLKFRYNISEKKECENCGVEIKNMDDLFCRKCGTKLQNPFEINWPNPNCT